MAHFLSSGLINIISESQIRGDVEDVVYDVVSAVEQWHHEEDARFNFSEQQKVTDYPHVFCAI